MNMKCFLTVQLCKQPIALYNNYQIQWLELQLYNYISSERVHCACFLLVDMPYACSNYWGYVVSIYMTLTPGLSNSIKCQKSTQLMCFFFRCKRELLAHDPSIFRCNLFLLEDYDDYFKCQLPYQPSRFASLLILLAASMWMNTKHLYFQQLW